MSDATESVIGRTPPNPPQSPSTRLVVGSTIAVVLVGAGVAVQTSVNGHVAVLVDSSILAATINQWSGLAVGLIVALAIGSLPRAWRNLRARRAELRWWWFLGGVMGLCGIIPIVMATPELGVVTVGVAVTLGQLGGSVIADSTGLGPGGRRGLSLLRLGGIVVAIAAILVGSVGRFEAGNLALIPLVVAAGLIIAIQQAANGWVVVATGGEWATMTVINFIVSGIGVGVVLLIQVSISMPDFGAIPWWAPAGGLVGAANGVVLAISVRSIGVLTSMLCIAAGQSVFGILADLLLPVDAVGVTAGSIAAAILAVVAVGLAGLPGPRRRGGRIESGTRKEREVVSDAE